MRRGDIVLVSLDPVVGSEQGKVRPAVVVSNDGTNISATQHGRGVVTVVPLTSNVSSVYPFQVVLTPDPRGVPQPSKAQCEQVRSIDVGRVVQTVGRVAAEPLAEIDDALRLHLAL